jgi:hypothetical protein
MYTVRLPLSQPFTHSRAEPQLAWSGFIWIRSRASTVIDNVRSAAVPHSRYSGLRPIPTFLDHGTLVVAAHLPFVSLFAASTPRHRLSFTYFVCSRRATLFTRLVTHVTAACLHSICLSTGYPRITYAPALRQVKSLPSPRAFLRRCITKTASLRGRRRLHYTVTEILRPLTGFLWCLFYSPTVDIVPSRTYTLVI